MEYAQDAHTRLQLGIRRRGHGQDIGADHRDELDTHRRRSAPGSRRRDPHRRPGGHGAAARRPDRARGDRRRFLPRPRNRRRGHGSERHPRDRRHRHGNRRFPGAARHHAWALLLLRDRAAADPRRDRAGHQAREARGPARSHLRGAGARDEDRGRPVPGAHRAPARTAHRADGIQRAQLARMRVPGAARHRPHPTREDRGAGDEPCRRRRRHGARR